MAKTSSADLRLLLSDKMTEAIAFFNEYDNPDAIRAVEDIVDDMMETMGIEFNIEGSSPGRIVASVKLYDPTEYFTGIVIDSEE